MKLEKCRHRETSILVRKATEQDIENVLSLVREFVTSFEVIEPKYRTSFCRLIVDASALVLVAEKHARMKTNL